MAKLSRDELQTIVYSRLEELKMRVDNLKENIDSVGGSKFITGGSGNTVGFARAAGKELKEVALSFIESMDQV